MNISGVRPYAGFYEYNSIRSAELRSSQVMAANEQSAKDTTDGGNQNSQSAVVPEAAQNFTSFDFAQNYDPNASYDLKGADSDINNLDTMKAISDLDKDLVLRQYQYFVGSKDNGVTQIASEPANRVVRGTEDFSL